jgi:PhnB protein
MARTSTYLNFNRKTEEAFRFYQSIFGGDFGNDGIARYRDMPPSDDLPPVPEADLDLVIHIELAILGGHILMGSDAPESMGFRVQHGNTMHLNLEPDTKEEAQRLFDALSEGGNISMPLQDMFWGAYFGSCTDKYGINWMVNWARR